MSSRHVLCAHLLLGTLPGPPHSSLTRQEHQGTAESLVKKIRDTTGIFHAKMGLIQDRNGMDLTEAEDIKKR